METQLCMTRETYDAIHASVRSVMLEEIGVHGMCIDTETCAWDGCNLETISASVALVVITFDTGEYEFDYWE